MASLRTEDILRDNNTTDPNSITSLTLTHKALSNVSCLSVLRNLERLDLTFNNLSSLEGLEGCVNLKWLCVQQNQLHTLKGIEYLTNLTVFNAGKNKLRSMDEVKNLLKLRALILNDNEITSISGLDQLTELNTLVLSRNPISKIGNSLTKLKSIIKISLSSCHLDAIDSSIKACTELEQLRLSHNDIKTLPAELGCNKKLQILDIGNNMLSRWSDLEALSSLRSLKNLNLLGNPIAEKAKLLKKINKLAPSLQIFNSKRMDQLNHVPKSKVERAVDDAGNDVKPLKKNVWDSGDVRQIQDNGNTIKKEKFSETVKVETKSADAKSKESVVMGASKTTEPNEEAKLKKSKKKKENRVEKEVPVQQVDRTETDKKSKRKAEKAGVDVIDDKERSFMELIDYDTPVNMNPHSAGKMDTIGAVVTYPAKNKKSKGAKTSAVELLVSAPEVGLGGPSAWDV
ncbi:hypothetical protein RND81_05G253600 [Saponaria officinalis]|uniref:Protein phosphatase 1 regulatory subunit 7 n=1 Tax=Saponaria officinalis TaxID=3572 RepID=A0AAW1L298_SAPOF